MNQLFRAFLADVTALAERAAVDGIHAAFVRASSQLGLRDVGTPRNVGGVGTLRDAVPIVAAAGGGAQRSTTALAGDDATYRALKAALVRLGERRDALAAQMITALDRAELHGGELRRHETRELIEQAERLLHDARGLPH